MITTNRSNPDHLGPCWTPSCLPTAALRAAGALPLWCHSLPNLPQKGKNCTSQESEEFSNNQQTAGQEEKPTAGGWLEFCWNPSCQSALYSNFPCGWPGFYPSSCPAHHQDHFPCSLTNQKAHVSKAKESAEGAVVAREEVSSSPSSFMMGELREAFCRQV